MRLLDQARHWISAHPEPEIDASIDADLALALEVFPGARIIAAGQPVCWPPEGGWIPSAARTVDPNATERPTAQCPVCGALAWHRAGTGFTCSLCHPPPNTSPVAVADVELDGALFRLAERAGFPSLALLPAVTVLAGQHAWRRFAALTTSASLRASALAGLLGREAGEKG